jgi:hypothetical protein
VFEAKRIDPGNDLARLGEGERVDEVGSRATERMDQRDLALGDLVR